MTLRLTVRAAVDVRIRRRGRLTVVTGRVRGGHVPRAGLRMRLQSRGFAGWRTRANLRTDGLGRFTRASGGTPPRRAQARLPGAVGGTARDRGGLTADSPAGRAPGARHPPMEAADRDAQAPRSTASPAPSASGCSRGRPTPARRRTHRSGSARSWTARRRCSTRARAPRSSRASPSARSGSGRWSRCWRSRGRRGAGLRDRAGLGRARAVGSSPPSPLRRGGRAPPRDRAHPRPARPPRRRGRAAVRRPPARRLARERRHPAARARRPGADDPPLPPPRLHARRAGRQRHADRAARRAARARGASGAATCSSAAAPARARPRAQRALSFIDPGERVVTIEDAAELRLRQPHVSGSRRARPTSKAAARSRSGGW